MGSLSEWIAIARGDHHELTIREDRMALESFPDVLVFKTFGDGRTPMYSVSVTSTREEAKRIRAELADVLWLLIQEDIKSARTILRDWFKLSNPFHPFSRQQKRYCHLTDATYPAWARRRRYTRIQIMNEALNSRDEFNAWKFARRYAITRFRRSFQAWRDRSRIFIAAREGRPMELEYRLRWGKLAGGLDLNGDCDGQLMSPLEAATKREHAKCIKLLHRAQNYKMSRSQRLQMLYRFRFVHCSNLA